ncbi:MAG: hypothetical protein IJD03_02850, partial [Clostridia bacterium]|nr:hypothetical protein [Clostridia bacterium]
MSKRLIAAMLALLVSVSFSLNAIAASTPTVDLDAVFEEAKENYEASIRAKNRSIGEVQAPYYEEVELEDGSILVVEGYPTNYTCDSTELELNEEKNNIVYSLTS